MISIDVCAPDGGVVCFITRPTTSLKKIHEEYCERQRVSTTQLAFLYKGVFIDLTKTVEELGLKDDDKIDAILIQ